MLLSSSPFVLTCAMYVTPRGNQRQVAGPLERALAPLAKTVITAPTLVWELPMPMLLLVAPMLDHRHRHQQRRRRLRQTG